MAVEQADSEFHAHSLEICDLTYQDDTAVINKVYNKDRKFRHIDRDFVYEIFDATLRIPTLRVLKCQNKRVFIA